MFTGESAMSTVRRPSAHRDYIRQVARQTVILKLQGVKTILATFDGLS